MSGKDPVNQESQALLSQVSGIGSCSCMAMKDKCVVNGDHSLKVKEVDSTSSELFPPDGLGCKPVTPLTKISSEGASNRDAKPMKIPSDKAQLRVPPDGISRSTIISEEAMAKEATTFSLPSHNHKDSIPSNSVDPRDRSSGQPSSLPNGVVSGGARSSETKAASFPSTNQKETIPSRRVPPSGSVQSPLPPQALIVRASSDDPKSVKLLCKSEKDKGPTRAQPDGLSIQASSVTTDRAGNGDVKVVALPAKNGRTQSGAAAASGLSAQPSSVTTNAVLEGASNVASQEMSTAGHRIAGKSFSCPDDPAVAKKEESRELKRYNSELLPTTMEKKRKFKPSDPLVKTILGCLDLLEGLSRCLDKEYKYGSCKCWKHIAERFGIEEQEYQKFNCNQVHSPTEVMFEYLNAQNPEITIGDVKDGLHSIAREDVVRVLVEYEQNNFCLTLGPFIREKISRGLHKTRTPRINGTKSTFTAYSTNGQLKPRLILAEGFGAGLIQAAAYFGRESVSINALKRCPWFAEDVNDCCACSVFNYIPDFFGRETRAAVVGK